MPTCRTAILASTSSPHVAALLPATQAIVESNGTCVGRFEPNDTLPDGLDRLVVIGGDGTMLAAIRGSLGTGIPVLGVNAGRLGVLAQFDIESLRKQADAVFGDTPLVREHLVLAVEVFDATGERKLSSAAVNDCVLTAGAPFRMIELHMQLDGVEGPVLNGDGVIVSTPIGSTAYNVSAGGPILQPSIEAFAITPVAPHSLACRPIVASAETKIMFEISRANAGTTLVLDGQINHPIQIGDRIEVHSNPQRALLLGNADSPYWRTLIDKMRWAAPPTYRDRAP